MQTRKDKALRLLNIYKQQDYHYIDEGFSGIVFHDNNFVYKVHIPLTNSNYGEMDGLVYLRGKLPSLINSIHFYNLELFEIENIIILKFLYEKSEKVNKISEEEFIRFLAECWEKKIVCKSITKETNFIRVNGALKFIDYEILPYSDNLFLNSVARAYIYLKYPDLNEREYNRLKRSIINNFRSDILSGFENFLNKLLFHISFSGTNYIINKSLFEKENERDEITLDESIFWQWLNDKQYLSDVAMQIYEEDYQFNFNIVPKKIKIKPIENKVTLLIKTCPQDSPTIYQQVKHIIKQLASPDDFYERVMAIDKKEKHFLREYTNEGTLKELYTEIQKLINEKIIDYCLELPSNEIENTNYKWFGIRSKETHTNSNIPLTPQLYAFETVKGDYILQMDSDVLIGRQDYEHSFLADMIAAINENQHAISVGFNITKEKAFFVNYHAPKGGYKPEVRFSLIHKKRLLSSRPWPNKLTDGSFELSWYQSLQLHQQSTSYVSLRGGDPKSYYIHPQNYRKQCLYVWYTILDRVEKNIIPTSQLENFDLVDSFYEWTIPKRNEEIINLIIIEGQEDFRYFFRLFTSILNQDFSDYGIIVINNHSDHLLDKVLWNLLKNYPNVTYLHNKCKLTNLEALYLGIHYFVTNSNSSIVLVNPKDYFLGKNIQMEIKERMRMYKADILIGKQINSKQIENNGLFHVDFINTREFKSNLYSNLKVFKKELFERISLYELKREKKLQRTLNNFEKLSKQYEWFEDKEYATLFTLLVEISLNPIRFDFFNLVIDSRDIDINEIQISLENLRNKRQKISTNKIEDGRIEFPVNVNKLEIDITYDCNLKCLSCNRSCTQAPSKKDYITLDQIKELINESIELNKKWELINILGGEPTLHPKLLEIVNYLLTEYVQNFSQNTVIQITSNGFTKYTRGILLLLPKSKNIVLDRLSFKKSRKISYFTQFNIAPIDLEDYKNRNFSKGCWVTSYCGMGMNKYGYYPCGIAAAMDRVIGLDIGLKSLRSMTVERMEKLKTAFCRYCGNFVDSDRNLGNFIPRCEKANFNKEKISDTWVKFYKIYSEKKPNLIPLYSERESI